MKFIKYKSSQHTIKKNHMELPRPPNDQCRRQNELSTRRYRLSNTGVVLPLSMIAEKSSCTYSLRINALKSLNLESLKNLTPSLNLAGQRIVGAPSNSSQRTHSTRIETGKTDPKMKRCHPLERCPYDD